MRRAHRGRQDERPKLFECRQEPNTVVAKCGGKLLHKCGALNGGRHWALFQTPVDFHEQFGGTARGFFEGFALEVKRRRVGRSHLPPEMIEGLLLSVLIRNGSPTSASRQQYSGIPNH